MAQSLSERYFSKIIRNEKNLNLSGRGFSNVLFDNCKILSIAGASFFNCTFENCELISTDLRDALTVTVGAVLVSSIVSSVIIAAFELPTVSTKAESVLLALSAS